MLTVKQGKYITLKWNEKEKSFEIWHKTERWDWGITNRDEAIEVWKYAEKHYTDGLR